MSLLTYTTLSPSNVGPMWAVGQWLFNAVGGIRTIKAIWYIVIVIHLAEAAYVQKLCVKHRTGTSVGVSGPAAL